MPTLPRLPLFAVLVLLLVACAGNQPASPTAVPPPAATATSTVAAPATPTPLPAPSHTASPAPSATATPLPPTPAPQATATAPLPSPTPLPETGEQVNPAWQVTSIDLGIKPALALDSADRPHLVYMVESEHGYVKYATLAGDGWQRQIVAEGYLYGPPDIGVGPDDRPQIVYHDHQDLTFQPNKGDAVRALLREGQWLVAPIHDPGHDGWDNSIVIDSKGTAHTASIDPSQFGSQDGVEYAVFNGSWQVEQIGSGPIAYEFGTSIAVNGQDQPGVTYFDDVLGVLRYGTRDDAGQWTLVTVDDGAGVGVPGKFSSLAYDAAGVPHISYFLEQSATSGLVRYATWDGSAWQIEDVDQVNDVVQGTLGARHLTRLRLDGQGRPVIAYNDRSLLKVAARTAAGWQVEQVAEAGDKPFGQIVGLDLDSAGRPHLVYTIFTIPIVPEGVVRYAARQEPLP